MNASTTEQVRDIASTSGLLVTESFPLFAFMIGLFLTLFMVLLMYKSIVKAVKSF